MSGERAYQTTLTGATGARNAAGSQMQTASWNAALTPSHGGSRLSSKAGPPLHVNELQSQESARKANHRAVEGQYMNHI